MLLHLPHRVAAAAAVAQRLLGNSALNSGAAAAGEGSFLRPRIRSHSHSKVNGLCFENKRFQVRCSSGSSSSSSTRSTMSLHHVPEKSLHVSTPTWWLESRFHFSFAEYFDPRKHQFGVLRVLNDDLVKPHAGFGTHPHRDMEIVTYVVDGELTHKDSMGTAESLGRGSVQYMSAGTGVTHSEMNSGDKGLRFLQVWILPKSKGLPPNYGSRIWSKDQRHNKIQHLVTDVANVEDVHAGIIPIHQDANFFASEVDPGVSQSFSLQKRRQAYLVNIEGSLSVNGTVLPARDAIEIKGDKTSETELELKADEKQGAHFLLIEMPLA